jgi:mannitol-1-/sugar-/sorbitol-6-phosphatase
MTFDLRAIDALLLDMDGTLVDSDAAVERAWRAWSAVAGVDADEVLSIAHGSPAITTVRRLLPGRSDEEVRASAAMQLGLQYDDLSDTHATPGAHRLVATLETLRIPWAVVTSADRRLAAARLAAGGIAPPQLVTEEDVPAGKPDPAGYLLGAARLGIDPTRCLVVEDAEPGLVAGRAAGARTAALKGLTGDLSLRDLGQLADLLLARPLATPSA